MQKRYIGSARLALSALGLGCMPMAGMYGSNEEAESLRVLARASARHDPGTWSAIFADQVPGS